MDENKAGNFDVKAALDETLRKNIDPKGEMRAGDLDNKVGEALGDNQGKDTDLGRGARSEVATKYWLGKARKERGEYQQEAVWDRLTGLMSKDNGEKMFDNLIMAFNNGKPFKGLGEKENIIEKVKNMGVINLDIDFFSWVNNICGHKIGDMMLEEVGGFIRNSFKEKDIAIRDGGEEFLILSPNIGESDNGLENLKNIANRFSKNFNEQLLNSFIGNQLVIEGKRRRAKNSGMYKEVDGITEAVRVMLINLKNLNENKIIKVEQEDGSKIEMSAKEHFMSYAGEKEKKLAFLEQLAAIMQPDNILENDFANEGKKHIDWYIKEKRSSRELRDDMGVAGLGKRQVVETYFVPDVLRLLFKQITISGGAVFISKDKKERVSGGNIKGELEEMRLGVKQSGRKRIDIKELE